MNRIQAALRTRFANFRDGEDHKGNQSGRPISPKLTKTQMDLKPVNIPSTVPDPTSIGATSALLYQAWEWYTSSDPHSGNSYWKQTTAELPHLKELGVSIMWLPPGCKAGNPHGNGYDIYDLWDLGEFDWKGQRPTKWGCKEELDELSLKAKEEGIGLMWDAVLNHRTAADFSENIKGVRVNDKDRRREMDKPRDMIAWTGFDFPARQGKYSELKLRKEHFNGVDWDDKAKEHGLFKFCDEQGKPKQWAQDVDLEFGNFDYLMFTNLTYADPALRSDVYAWGSWITKELSLSGIRLDAMKHVSQSFILEFIKRMQAEFGNDFLVLGEYWKWDSKFLATLIRKMEGRCRLYDTQLCYNFSDHSVGKKKDLRRVLQGTLTELDPAHAVTLVTSHDTQPTQTLAVEFESWFLPHAYALILLRACASLPCVFNGHLRGIAGPEPQAPLLFLPALMRVRRLFAYGMQYNYWDESDCIGWTRVGREGNITKEGCAVLLSSSPQMKRKRMFLGENHKGATFVEVGKRRNVTRVVVEDDGWSIFEVSPRGAGVWIRAEAAERLR